jgi:hypothetical protein
MILVDPTIFDRVSVAMTRKRGKAKGVRKDSFWRESSHSDVMLTIVRAGHSSTDRINRHYSSPLPDDPEKLQAPIRWLKQALAGHKKAGNDRMVRDLTYILREAGVLAPRKGYRRTRKGADVMHGENSPGAIVTVKACRH